MDKDRDVATYNCNNEKLMVWPFMALMQILFRFPQNHTVKYKEHDCDFEGEKEN